MYRSLYIHVPFCHGGKCDYCAFYSRPDSTEAERRQYLGALEAECEKHAHECAPLRSVFLGGGTPGALPPSALERLLSIVRRHFTLLPDCEWTMEANPDSLTAEKLALAAEAGVNRLSLGVQAFDPDLRDRIGRRGSLANLEAVLAVARQCGIPGINLDLIWGIPGETIAQWRAELRRAIACAPDHLSCYRLTLELGTPLHRRLADNGTDDDFIAAWDATDELLGETGLARYEISNFARPGRRCRHNWEVWHGQTYLGCGPAAASFDGTDRRTNPPDLAAWLAGAPPALDQIPPAARARELLAFALRTCDGWTWSALADATGITRDDLLHDNAIQRVHAAGLLSIDDHGLRPTRQGLLCNDDLLAEVIA